MIQISVVAVSLEEMAANELPNPRRDIRRVVVAVVSIGRLGDHRDSGVERGDVDGPRISRAAELAVEHVTDGK